MDVKSNIVRCCSTSGATLMRLMEVHIKYMKDIYEVQDFQPHTFNYVHCRGVAAKAGSVHLMDWKLG